MRRASIPVIAGIVGVAIVASAFLPARSDALSLATDVGITDQELCTLLDQHGRTAVQRLEASGFPHATKNQREVYRLLNDGRTEAVLLVDWGQQRAECLPLTYAGVVDVEVRMTPKAYAAFVGEIRSVIREGSISLHPGNLLPVWVGTDVVIPGGVGNLYELKAAAWAAGWLVDNGGV